ncbi:hypothetical protein Baya_14285 [Bagarius yarrelli]|uniref:Uncharacterized protein n=1 Tax=Bagarius yarrelli TaxID=175774 RepID=A0A556V932_BAGYA|nr:hypothetical protein Baya_14285 [Bagarius yarrelli]
MKLNRKSKVRVKSSSPVFQVWVSPGPFFRPQWHDVSWRRVLGDGERDEKERGHREEKSIPGWTAAADALLQFWDLRIIIIICEEKLISREVHTLLPAMNLTGEMMLFLENNHRQEAPPLSHGHPCPSTTSRMATPAPAPPLSNDHHRLMVITAK